jgi:hypothetical protein
LILVLLKIILDPICITNAELSELQAFCDRLGITYVNKKELGNISGTADWIPPDRSAADRAIEHLSSLDGNLILMCAEKDHRVCHRTSIAIELSGLTGRSIEHLPS